MPNNNIRKEAMGQPHTTIIAHDFILVCTYFKIQNDMYDVRSSFKRSRDSLFDNYFGFSLQSSFYLENTETLNKHVSNNNVVTSYSSCTYI